VRYVARFDCTEQRLRTVLTNKVEAMRTTAHVEGVVSESIDRLIDRFKELGYLNDRRFAERLVESLRLRGASTRKIRDRLRSRGVRSETAAEVLSHTGQEDDFTAAVAWVKRRRLGVHRPIEQRKLKYQRDLAALARAGFSFEVARKALAVATPECE
jgi:regulatory protein